MEIDLQESFGKTLTIDKEKGVIFNVKAIGTISKNGLVFPKETRLKAHALLEGCKVNLDHVRKGNTEVPLATRFGKLVNFRSEDDGTYADLHYLKSHPMAAFVQEIAESHPELCGLSIRGGAKAGRKKDNEGRTIVNEITSVSSIDLVSDPANTISLAESTLVEEDYAVEGCLKAIAEILAQDGTSAEKFARVKLHIEQLGGLESEVEESIKDVRQECVKLCEQYNVNPDDTFLDLLSNVPEDKRELLVKKKKIVSRPKSGTPVLPIHESITVTESEEDRLARLTKLLKGN